MTSNHAPSVTPQGKPAPAPSSWSEILDELELAVAAAEQTLDGTLEAAPAVDREAVRADRAADPTANRAVNAAPDRTWLPPLPDGPLPAYARDRAVALSAAQARVSKRLEEARLDVSRQLQAISSVPGMSASSRAVYLDVSG